MKRIHQAFEGARERGGALIIYLTAGDPSLEVTGELALAAERGGADLVELGIPYSDPIADGPTIQNSYTRALDRQLRLSEVFDLVRSARTHTDIPLLGMVSYSLIYRRGLDRFVREAAQSGLDGLIVPDLPVEEADLLAQKCAEVDLAAVYLIAPTTTVERRRLIAQWVTGFIYCVSVVGTTGARDALPSELISYLDELRQLTDKPLAVGFGISRPEQAVALAPHADGVIVGSAIVRLMEEHLQEPQVGVAAVERFVTRMVESLASVRKPAR
ncbi:MAG: tryptophan synthase subunit alpha [Planctomycetes bacterium]|nr:tryptophan synthase subunit alpha [Planctomycetota bacterium]